jgi:hypothetical protein
MATALWWLIDLTPWKTQRTSMMDDGYVETNCVVEVDVYVEEDYDDGGDW